jgi:hypothetical protein
VNVEIHIFLTSVLAGGEMVSFTPRPLYPWERPPSTHLIGGWVDLRAGLDDVEKRKFLTLLGLELRPLGRPAHSQSLNRLCYPGSLHIATVYLCSQVTETISKQSKILVLITIIC